MKCLALVAAVLVPAGVAVGVGLGGDLTRSARGRSLADTELRVGIQGVTRTIGTDSFCAAPNGEPVTLACGGLLRAPRSAPLPVRPGSTMSLRFGAAVERVSIRTGGPAGKAPSLP